MTHSRNRLLIRGISETPVHNGVCECLHARNQRHVHFNSKWSALCSDFVCSEAAAAKSANDAKIAVSKRMLTNAVTGAAPGPPGEAASQQVVSVQGLGPRSDDLPKGQHPLAVFMQKRIKALKRSNQPVPPVCGPWWKELGIEFNGPTTSEEERNSCRRIAAYNNSQPRTKQRTNTVVAQALVASKHGSGAISDGDAAVGADNRAALVASPIGGGDFLSVPSLRPDQRCGVCGCIGSEHRLPRTDLSLMLRSDPDSTAALLSPGKPTLSEHPLSESRFAAEKAEWSGGLKAISNAFDQHITSVGRNLGGIPDSLPGRHRCGDLCIHELSDAQRSLEEQLRHLVRDVVNNCGGVKHVPEKQPCAA